MADVRYLVCGGCGFIGANFVELLHASRPEAEIVIVDLLTYAGSLDNLGELLKEPQIRFVQADIADPASLLQLHQRDFDLIVNFAAETHVDRSLYQADRFARSNVLGVVNLIAFCRETENTLLQISTDEVYGPAREIDRFDEQAHLNPSSVYATSKAAADMMILSAITTFNQQAAIVRTCNNYGPKQFPEKLIPFFVHRADREEALPLYGDGRQRRCWIHVTDFCAALLKLLDDFPTGEILNVGSDIELENLQVAQLIREALGSDSEIKFVADRPAHDLAYRMDSSKYEERYGEIGSRAFESGLKQTISWYLDHRDIFERLSAAETSSFIETHYRDRL